VAREEFEERRDEMFDMGDQVEVRRPEQQIVEDLIRGGSIRFTELQIHPLFTR